MSGLSSSNHENTAEYQQQQHESGLGLPVVARGTLLSEADRIERLVRARPGILATIEGETDEIAIEASLACLLWETLIQTNWCGFYRRVEDRLLKVGPYQGRLGCLSISYDRGVCGASARTEKRILVPNVHEFPGHIACDSNTNSELVMPFRNKLGKVIGVLDLDCMELNGFSPSEADILEQILQQAFSQVDC